MKARGSILHPLTVGASLYMTFLQSGLTTADAVYTAAQAARGRALYETVCQTCHGPTLAGGVGRALTGERFATNWNGITLDRLFERVRTMPPDATTSREDAASLDLVAYILSANAFPDGSRPLTVDGLERIAIESRDVDAVPNFSLVQVVGCLARGGGREWLMNRATTPVRTKNPAPSSGDERARAAAMPPGSQTLRLLNAYPSPDALVGHLVEAKGFLIADTVSTLNVTALASLAAVCPD